LRVYNHSDRRLDSGVNGRRQRKAQGLIVLRLDTNDNGLWDFVEDLAEGQRLEEVHLVQRVFGPDPLRDGVPLQPVKVAGVAPVANGIHHNEVIGLGYHAQQIDPQHPAIHHQDLVREFVIALNLFDHADTEPVIRVEDRADPEDHDLRGVDVVEWISVRLRQSAMPFHR
jgi:hypothetical protein